MYYKINKYPDGSSYVEHDTISRGITFRVNSYEDLWHLNQLLDSLRNDGAEEITIITIPNLLDAQADKRFGLKQSSGLKLVCNLLNQYNNQYVIFHPHNPEVVEALLNNVGILDNSTFIEKVLEKLLPINNLVMLSPDAGAYKWIIKTADKVQFRNEVFTASKSREWDRGKSVLTQVVDKQDFNGRDVLIVDDICVRGGTFLGLAKLLKSRNIGKLYLAVSHITLQAPNPELFEIFDRVFTTNSKFDNYFTPQKEGGVQPKNLDVYNMFKV